MKPLLWFRLYAEIVDDVKLLTLAPSDRWFYVGILACKAQGLLDGDDAVRRFSHVQIKLRLTEMELEEAARRLAEAGLIDENSLQPLKWDKRQFRSDHDDRKSADRVRSWREKRRNQTVTAVTPPHVTRLKPRPETETETEAETEKKKKRAEARATRLALDSCPEDWSSFCKTERPDLNVKATWERFSDYWRSVPGSKGTKLDWFATWRNWVRNERAASKADGLAVRNRKNLDEFISRLNDEERTIDG